MKTLFKNYLALSLILISVLSCKEDDPLPVSSASFEYTTDQQNPLMVSFTNTSENAVSYSWDFGDQATSTETNPIHIYSEAGTYNVVLTATNSSGANDVKEATITIKQLYLDEIYQDNQILKSSNIQYGSNTQYNILDLFEVPDNQDDKRPLILLSPGGGFVTYNQTVELEEMAKDLAQRGYVVACVKYTIDSELDISNQEATSRIWMQAMQDQKSAIRFFKNNAVDYRIDPDKLFIGGWSNGATVALTTGFLQESEVDAIANTNMKDLVNDRIAEMGFEGTDNTGADSSVKGALILNGYAFDVNFLDANDPSLMIIYHEKSRLLDGTLILDTFEAGNDPYYGLLPIVEQAESVGYVEGANLESIIMYGPSNEPNYAPLESSNYDDIADFFHRNLE